MTNNNKITVDQALVTTSSFHKRTATYRKITTIGER